MTNQKINLDLSFTLVVKDVKIELSYEEGKELFQMLKKHFLMNECIEYPTPTLFPRTGRDVFYGNNGDITC